MSGINKLEELESAGFSINEIESYRKTESQKLKSGGFTNDEIKNYWGISDPDTSEVKSYWQKIVDYKNKIKEEGVPLTPTEQVNQDFGKKVKKSLVGETFEIKPYVKSGATKSVINLMMEYHGEGELPKAFSEPERNDTGHIERAIETLSQIVPDLPLYAAAAIPAAIVTKGNAFATAGSAGLAVGTIRQMYVGALTRGDVNTFGEWWSIFTDEALEAGVKEGLQLGVTAQAPALLGMNKLLPSLITQYAAFNATGALLEQQLPTKDELINTALVFGALGFGAKGIKKVNDTMKTENVTGDRLIQEALLDPRLKEDLVSTNIEKPRIFESEKKVETVKTKPTIERLAELNKKSLTERNAIEIVEFKALEKLQQEGKLKSEATEQVLDRIEIDIPTEKITFEKIVEVSKEAKNDAATLFFDKLHPIYRVVKEADKSTLKEGALNPYETLRIQPGMIGRAETFINRGTLDFATLDIKGKSLLQIMEPIKDPTLYKEFSAYAIAKRAMEKEAQGIKTGVPLEAAKQTVKENNTKFEKIHKELQQYNTSLLTYLKDAGVLDTKTFEVILEANKDYVPFFRVLEGKDGPINKSVSNPIMEMKGSTKVIQDPINSIFNNTYQVITMAERNNAFVKLIEMVEANKIIKNNKFSEIYKVGDNAKPIKISVKELEGIIDTSKLDKTTLDNLTIFRKNGQQVTDTQIALYRNGKKEIWEVGPDIAKALKDSNGVVTELLLSRWGSWATKPASWLRAGATLAPDFFARNMTRDTVSAAIFSKGFRIPFLTSMEGAFHMVKRGPLYDKWIKSGGIQSMIVSMDKNYFDKNIKSELTKTKVHNLITEPKQLIKVMLDLSNPIKLPGRTLDVLRDVSSFAESMTRVGEFSRAYRQAQKQNLTKREALERGGFEGRDITIDFKKMGSTIQAVNLIAAFFNARLQGYAKMYDSFKNRPVGTMTKVGAFIVTPSVLLWIKNHDNETYKQLPRWQKDLFWIVITGEGDDEVVYRIPKPFEPGILFGTGTERALDYVFSEDPSSIKKFIKELALTNLKNLGPVPELIKPIVEQWSNKSLFSGQPIIPFGQENILPEYQYTDYTSETAKFIGKSLQHILGDKNGMTSPARIENIINNWTGTLGKYVLDAADKALIATGTVKDPIKPTDKLSDIPFIKAFVVRNPSSGSEYIETFYETFNDAKIRFNTINKLTDPNEIIKQFKILTEEGLNTEQGPDGILQLSLEGEATAMQGFRELIDLVYKNPTIPPDEKRQLIDQSYQGMIDLAKNALNRINNVKKSTNKPLEININPTKEELGIN
tara:strand:- start:1657 stop:5550 length:3894 start_codon:yes stop_codon:yes gene_type:complete